MAITLMARIRYRRAIRLLSQGQVLVTDRLHGYILGSLLGMPTVVLDNGYGKLRRYVSSWPLASHAPMIADDPDEAYSMARVLLGR
jgi:pyruvyl transferase EpsO